MTDHPGCELRELLPVSRESMEDAMKNALCENPGIRPSRLAWGFIGTEATTALRGVLDCDVFELVARGWCVAKELLEYADPARHPPGERSIVHLGAHSFVKTIHPVLDVTIDAVHCPLLRFTVELAANFRAVALSIADGHVTAAGGGDGDVSAQLKYGDVALLHKETRRVPFPLRIEFNAPGLPIGRPSIRAVQQA